MKIELSQFEVELLDAALTVWEKEPSTDASMSGIMGAIFSGIAGRDGNSETAATIKNDMKQMRADADKSVQKRRIQAALLRAKLLQSLAIDSEHAVEQSAITPPQAVSSE